MKVAIYSRVSKDVASSDGVLQDVENQLVPLRNYAKAMGYEVYAEYVDKMSGGSADRPDFQRMMVDAFQRKFDMVLVWSLDRFSREGILSTMSYIRNLKEMNVSIKSLQEGWLDTSNEGFTELLLAIFSWVAERERKKISERTKAGLSRAKSKGKSLGRPTGSKDKKVRRRSGYWKRWMGKKKKSKTKQ